MIFGSISIRINIYTLYRISPKVIPIFKLMKINGFLKHSFVLLSLLHLCCYMAASKRINSVMNKEKSIKSMLAQANKLLN